MEKYELVEKLVEKSGASYTEAKEALENCGWDLLDAMIWLEEKNGVGQNTGRYTSEAGEPEFDGNENPYRSSRETSSTLWEKIKKLMKRIWKFLVENRITMSDREEKEILTVPVLVVAILCLFSFGLVILAAIISLCFGCRYTFHGPDLGKESVNDASRKVGEKMEDLGQEIQQKFDEFTDKKDTDR